MADTTLWRTFDWVFCLEVGGRLSRRDGSDPAVVTVRPFHGGTNPHKLRFRGREILRLLIMGANSPLGAKSRLGSNPPMSPFFGCTIMYRGQNLRGRCKRGSLDPEKTAAARQRGLGRAKRAPSPPRAEASTSRSSTRARSWGTSSATRGRASSCRGRRTGRASAT